jgi:hypothetical protein
MAALGAVTLPERGEDQGASAFSADHGAEARREYILAELRCAAARARLAALDIDAVGQALRARIIDPDQAAALLWETDTVHYLGMEAQ